MIIGLHGHKRSGKDTAYNIITTQYPHAIRLAFADKIKESLAALFGVWAKDIEYLKETNPELTFFMEGRPVTLSWREVIQRYGTEAHRDIFGEEFWLDALLPKPDESGIASHQDELWIITDVRFPNEAVRIKQLGGYVIDIKRPSTEENDKHRLERTLDRDLIDCIVYNSGTLEQLNERILKAVGALLSR